MFRIDCPVIFAIAYDGYAIRALRVNRVDYLLTPIDDEELKTAIDKSRNILKSKAVLPTDIHLLKQTLTQPQTGETYHT